MTIFREAPNGTDAASDRPTDDVTSALATGRLPEAPLAMPIQPIEREIGPITTLRGLLPRHNRSSAGA